MYRAATQMQKNGEVVVSTLRCPNDDEMRDLLKRIRSVRSLADFYFCEVHRYMPDKPNEMTVVVGNINAPYPVGAKEKIETVVYSPRTANTVRTTPVCADNSCAMPDPDPREKQHPRLHRTIKVA